MGDKGDVWVNRNNKNRTLPSGEKTKMQNWQTMERTDILLAAP